MSEETNTNQETKSTTKTESKKPSWIPFKDWKKKGWVRKSLDVTVTVVGSVAVGAAAYYGYEHFTTSGSDEVIEIG